MTAVGLVGRELVRKGALEFLLPVRVRREGVALDGLARGIELEQLVGHVAHRLLDARLGLLPRRAAEAIERRAAAARELLHQVEPVDGDEELVVTGVAQFHELARLVTDVDLLQPDEDTDAVVDVDDVVADLEVAEVREEGLGGRGPALVADAFLVEDVGLGKEPHLRGGKPEALRELPGRDEQRAAGRDLGAADVDRDDAVVAQDLDHAFGAARGLGHEHRRLALLSRSAQFADPLGHAAVKRRRRLTRHVAVAHRRAHRVGRVRSAIDHVDVGGKRLELGGRRQHRHHVRPRQHQLRRREHPFLASERVLVAVEERREAAVAGLAHLVELGHEQPQSGGAAEVAEEGRRTLGLPALERVGRLADRRDGHAIERGDRSLRRRIELADGLDGVADELEADRQAVAGREDVGDAAANRELAVLIDRILARESGPHQDVGQFHRVDVVARLELERRRHQRAGIRQPGQERGGGCDDDPGLAGGERRAGHGRGPTPRRSAAAGPDRGRLPATAAPGHRDRAPRHSALRGCRGRSARR